MGKFKKIFLSKKAIALELVLALVLAGALWFFINKASNNFSQDPDMGLVNGSDGTMISTPIDGTKPSDHDPKKNAYYALYALNKANSFVTHCEGETITQVAFVGVSQKIKSMRIVNNGEIYKESLSHSSFKGVGVRNYINGNNYVTLNANTVSSIDEVVWNSEATKISKDDYVALYGYVPNGISGYILTDDTILSAEYLGEENGVFSYRYELDTTTSVAKLALEMRTMAGTASLPIFEKASLTIRIDENWNIISTTTNSVYKVDMLGGVTCTEDMTEIFSNIGDNVEIPNVEFYRGYLDDEVGEIGPEQLTASDYLMQGFGEYITGGKPLKVSLALSSTDANLPLSANANALINIDINDLSNISAFIDLSSLTYDDWTFNDIAVAYNGGDLYLGWKDIKAKANVSETFEKLEDLLPLFGAEMPALDLGNIDLASLLESASVNKDGNNVSVCLPLSLAGIDLTATLNFVEDDGISFVGATASVMGLEVSLNPDDDIIVDTTLDGYSDLLSLLDVIDENGKIALDVAIGDLNAEVVLAINPFALDLKLGDITAKLSDNVVYINYKDIKAKLDIDDIDGILNTLAPILETHGVALPDMSGIANIDVNAILTEVLDNLTTATIDGGVKISTKVMDLPLDLVLSNANNQYTIASISTKIEDTAIVVEPTADSFEAITDTTDYCDITALLGIIDNSAISLKVSIGEVEVLVKVDLLTLDVDVKLGDITAKLSDNVIYVNYKDIKAKLDIDDIDGILNTLAPILETHGVALPDMNGLANIDVNAILTEILDNLTTSTIEGGVKISTKVMDLPLDLVLSNTDGKYTIASISTKIEDTAIVVEPTADSFDAITDTIDYCDITALLGIIDNSAISLKVSIGEVEVLVKVDLLTLDVDVKLGDITAKLSDNVVYINYKDIKAKLDIDDIDGILNTLAPILETHGVALPDMSALNNIDVNAILTEVLDNLTTATIDGGVKISTKVMDLPLDLVLSNTDGKYTIASISTKIEDTAIVVEPTADSFEAITDTTDYCDITALLGIIDNSAISLKVSIGEVEVLVKVDLLTLDVDVKLGDITAKLSDNVIYVNYKDIKAKLDIDDIDGILNTLAPILETHGVALPDMSGIANIDVNAILTEVLDNLTTSTIEGGVKISTKVMDLPLDLVLSNTDGKYTIASISTKIEDTEVLVVPTTDSFETISSDALGNYSNIATLLDMIDDNYDIHLSILFDGADIRVTFNLLDLTLTATYDGLEVYANLNTGDVYLTYPGVLAKVNINDAEYILGKLEPILAKFMDTTAIKDLDLGAVTNIDFGAILDTLTVTESEGKVVLGLDLNGVGVNVTFTTTDGMRLDSAVITMGDTDITAIVLDTPNVKPVFDFTLEYSDAKALVDEFSDILTAILYSDNLGVKVGGSIVSGNTQFTIVDSDITIANLTTAPKATAYVVLEQKDLTTGTAFTHTITLIYLDPSLVADGAVNVYFTYDNSLDNTSEKATKLEGTFTTTKAGETWDIIKEIYKLMPDIQKALDGILVPDENGYPTLPKFDFPVTELIKSISFKDGLLSGYLDTSVIIDSLPELLGAEIRKVDNTLNVTIPTFTMADMSIGLGVDITVPEATTVTDDKFSLDTTNASDFSSINELLMTLKNTATARSFHITGDIDASIGSLTIKDSAIKLDVKLDVTEDGLTFAKVVIQRAFVVGGLAWNDYDGTSTLYYDAENELIHVHIKYRELKGGLGIYWAGNTKNEYYTYTVEEFTSDLMTNIFNLIRLKSSWTDMINNASSEESSTNTATIENTLLGYSYGPNKDGKTVFTINLDLQPLTSDVRKTDLEITHDSDMKLSHLYAKTSIVGVLGIDLDADMISQGVYQGVKEEIASVKSQFPTK